MYLQVWRGDPTPPNQLCVHLDRRGRTLLKGYVDPITVQISAKSALQQAYVEGVWVLSLR